MAMNATENRMPFSTLSEFEASLNDCMSRGTWDQSVPLREIHDEGARRVEAGDLSHKCLVLLQNFEVRYNEHYAQEHGLQRFLNQLVQHTVRMRSPNPIVELISAIDKKVIS